MQARCELRTIRKCVSANYKEKSEGICMKRFHAHVRVDDLESSVRFYSTLFGTEPAVLKADYAKWMLDDPRVNFAITAGSTSTGLDHLGLQVESDEDLATIARRLDAAGQSVVKQENASCCYARGNKGWVSDPSGISWETFHTFGESTVYGNDVAPRPLASKPKESDSCCAPAPSSTACCSAAKAQP
jgi:catechol 2,3-dioxygenase-like lactoylglutathione lyase family enzyme